ncbi:Homocysteine S-methyltransferase [Pseudoruegeria aquimaris]|uniref:Homocysteine S-methyltransferase n=1 Tax=Pseudoruegeria aquimaris TaxID=393663 RepID=A0A1Y5S0D9_9RHOB|nr:homocysteine S-methyltransferase family protein [Pseudoruegeria aquimaris]SLN29588.1 Homocysteine S-methyltransferase [Pseudoruegeria aquimaris]
MAQIMLKDGGTGQELLRRSSMRPHPLWSAKVLMEEPEIVQAVHEDFLRAGARVLTLNTYATTPERLAREGAAEMFRPLQRRAIELAHAARAAAGAPGTRIAACLSPLHGSYRPDMSITVADLLPLYAEIIEGQVEASDLVLAETLSALSEIEAATRAALDTGLPTWVAVTLKDDGSPTLRSGEPLSGAVALLKDLAPTGLMLNCCRPEAISANLNLLADAGLPFGAYGNGFTGIDSLAIGGTADVLAARSDLTPEAYARFALDWVQAGASFVGGCCEVGPDHIATLAGALEAAGHDITGEIA